MNLKEKFILVLWFLQQMVIVRSKARRRLKLSVIFKQKVAEVLVDRRQTTSAKLLLIQFMRNPFSNN